MHASLLIFRRATYLRNRVKQSSTRPPRDDFAARCCRKTELRCANSKISTGHACARTLCVSGRGKTSSGETTVRVARDPAPVFDPGLVRRFDTAKGNTRRNPDDPLVSIPKPPCTSKRSATKPPPRDQIEAVLEERSHTHTPTVRIGAGLLVVATRRHTSTFSASTESLDKDCDLQPIKSDHLPHFKRAQEHRCPSFEMLAAS